MNIAALVPMKGHSERVKDKNIRELEGKPLLWYILKSLNESRYIGNVYVDTDSFEIINRIEKFFPQTKIIHRPRELCGDYVSMNKVINHDLSCIEEEVVLQTHATNPLLTPETIDKACEFYSNNFKEYDSIFTVNRIQTRLYDKSGRALNHDPNKLIRTQDLSPIYEENSNIYIFSKESFQKKCARIGEKPYMFEMDFPESIDIDEEKDFELVKTILKLYRGDISEVENNGKCAVYDSRN